MQAVHKLVQRHKAGESVGIVSICSAHPLVIEAALLHARHNASPFVLIEATSNQVNQDGGYTGMVPADFRAFVGEIAGRTGFPAASIVLGGDHLGPNAWTGLDAETAMAKAEAMVCDYVWAGFRKIHLDCSMSCADDPSPLPPMVIAERAARLCSAAEAAHEGSEDEAPLYVIGTEVPVPGGATEELGPLEVTRAEDALATIAMHRQLFEASGLGSAWGRVIAAVVQPGVEFDHDKVVDFRPEEAGALSEAIETVDGMVFEAHSTDYQTPAALAALVRRHFAILKVGPGLTFALREALWALDSIEREWIAPDRQARLRDVALGRMRDDPVHWRKYYHATGEELDIQLQYSLSDRIRYYWPDDGIAAAQDALFANLRASPPPLGLVSQYLPDAVAAVREAGSALDPAALVLAHIGTTLDAYHGACHPHV